MRGSRLRSRPKASTTDRDLALAWYTEVVSAGTEHRGRCVMCGRTKSDGRLQAHHPVRQQVIRNAYERHGALWDPEREAWTPARFDDEATRSHEQIRWDPSNGIPLCSWCHEPHTNRSRRVPLERLGEGPLAFAITHRDRFGTNFMVELEREHPPQAQPRGGLIHG